MKFSEYTIKEAQPLYNSIKEHPFVKELASGTLPEEKFLFYINQDALYLETYRKVLTGIGAKIESEDHAKAFLAFASDTIAVENALHEIYLQKSSARISYSPSCLLYTSFLARQLSLEPLEIAIAAVLPCFHIYKDVGDYILANYKENNNPYSSWINTYGGEEYASAVAKALEIYDAMAENTTDKVRKLMLENYLVCSRMEWLFWDSAYKLEKWLI